MKKILLASALAILLTANTAFSTQSIGTVGYVWQHNLISNHFLFEINGTPNESLECRMSRFRGAGGQGRYVVDTNTDQGKSIMSMILTAKATGKTVTVQGAHHCNEWGDAESVDWINVE